VHPEGIPESAELGPGGASGPTATAAPAIRQPSNPVDRVKKLWGEFF
jgi:hypothetical protein